MSDPEQSIDRVPVTAGAAIYIAARFSQRPECNALARALKEQGHTITSRWVKPDADHVLPTGLSLQAEDAERRRFAIEDCDDVRACDWVVSLQGEPRSGGRGGRHVEFGYGLALGKRMISIGPRETVFHHLDVVQQFDSAEAFLAWSATHRLTTERTVAAGSRASAEAMREAAARVVDATSRSLDKSSRAAYKSGYEELAQRLRAEEICRDAVASAIRALPLPAPDERGGEWPDIGPDPMKGDRLADRLDASVAMCRAAYVKQQAKVPDQTALVWRWHLGALIQAAQRLKLLQARTPEPSSPDAGGAVEALRSWTAKEAANFAPHDFDRYDRPRTCQRCDYVEHDGSGHGWHLCSVTNAPRAALAQQEAGRE